MIKDGQPFIKKCTFCGATFKIIGPRKTIRIKTAKYCSQKCHYKSGHSIKTREKISNSLTGILNPFYGRKHSEESLNIIRLKRSRQIITKENRIKRRESMLNNAKRGINHHNWKGGITPINKAIRNSSYYKEWRRAVFERDDYTCQFCGLRGVWLQADHIKSFALFPKDRFEITNGRTLCINCHRNTDTYGGRILNHGNFASI